MTSALGRRLWITCGRGPGAYGAAGVYLAARGSTARVAVADVVRENLSSVVSTQWESGAGRAGIRFARAIPHL